MAVMTVKISYNCEKVLGVHFTRATTCLACVACLAPCVCWVSYHRSLYSHSHFTRFAPFPAQCFALPRDTTGVCCCTALGRGCAHLPLCQSLLSLLVTWRVSLVRGSAFLPFHPCVRLSLSLYGSLSLCLLELLSISKWVGLRPCLLAFEPDNQQE